MKHQGKEGLDVKLKGSILFFSLLLILCLVMIMPALTTDTSNPQNTVIYLPYDLADSPTVSDLTEMGVSIIFVPDMSYVPGIEKLGELIAPPKAIEIENFQEAIDSARQRSITVSNLQSIVICVSTHPAITDKLMEMGYSIAFVPDNSFIPAVENVLKGIR